MEKITIFTKEEFRSWLVDNHDKKDKVSVIIYRKHTGKAAPSHRELMEEAICFGWIDTIINKLDEKRYIRNFSKRNKNSKWSNNTLQYAKNLIEQGKMTPQGLKFYKEGLNKPPFDFGIPKHPDMPDDLKIALDNDAKARDNFEKFPASIKTMTYRWILRAKREGTRKRRIKATFDKARANSRDVFGI